MAVKQRKSEAPAGAPAWMVTYGDMVTLLLTFFVLLVAMSEVKEDERLRDFMQAVREAFGYVGGERHLPTEEVQVPKNLDEMRVLVLGVLPESFGEANDEGLHGRRDRVEYIRPAEYYQPGARFQFAELSAELSAAEAAAVARYAEQLRGLTTIIEVRGHCSRVPVTGTPFRDHMELSIRRARAVADLLIANGIDPRRIHVVGAGTTQPLTRTAADIAERRRNDVVELLQTDHTIDEFEP